LSYDDSLDKDRLYFTQCNDTILLKCPECTSVKNLRQCKIFRNFPALWWHLKQEHTDILEIRMNEINQILHNVFKAFQLNMFPKWEYSKFIQHTTSSSFLIDGRPPRIDMLENLKKIAKLLKTQSEFFPKFKPKILLILIEKAIESKDPRTKKKYLNCIIKYSDKDQLHVLYDVTQFCKVLGA